MPTQFTLSQLIASISLILVFVGYQVKDKKLTLFILMTSNVVTAVSFVLLENWSGSLLFGLTAVRLLAFFFLEKYEPKQWIRISTLVLFVVVLILSEVYNPFNNSWITSQEPWPMARGLIVIAGAIVFTIGAWLRHPKFLRITHWGYCVLIIAFLHIPVGNLMALVTTATVMLSITQTFWANKDPKYILRFCTIGAWIGGIVLASLLLTNMQGDYIMRPHLDTFALFLSIIVVAVVGVTAYFVTKLVLDLKSSNMVTIPVELLETDNTDNIV